MSALSINWRLSPYEELSLQTLEGWLMLRQQVFVVEQQCPYPDIDGRDAQALHLLAWLDGQLVAGARLFAPDDDTPFSRIGRVVVASEQRREGLGRTLMKQALAQCWQRWPHAPVRISAQAHLQRFYGALGFAPVSDIYDEDGIPHLDMECTAPVSPPAASDRCGQ